jgi:NADH-quinone oxidoreductase subunit I
MWAGIFTTFLGMKLTFRHMFKPAVTLRYPEERPPVPQSHRGLHAYDETKWIGCRMCERNCPVECIKLEMVGRGKDGLITRYDVDYSKCLFCNLCAENCPTNCVWLSKSFNAACGERESCVRHLAKPKSDEDIARHMTMLAEKEAERKAQQAQKAAASATDTARQQIEKDKEAGS